MFKHILVPTDGSDLARAALRRGVDLAKIVGADVVQLTVDEPFNMIAVEDPILWVQTQQQYLDATAKRAEKILKAGEQYAESKGVKVTSLHEYDVSIHDTILRVAKKHGCDLIVMGSHGRKGIAALILGSTTYKVLAHAHIPVFVNR
jgi:nucleotide-binding universal stress UspA family protein